jgi:hypothetical protein
MTPVLGVGVRASQLYNARGKKLFPAPSSITTSTMSIAVQTTASTSNNNLKRRSEAATGVGGGSLKKSFHEQQLQHSKSQSEIVVLRREAAESMHSLANQPQAAHPTEGKLPKGGSAFFKKLFQR